MEGRFDRNIRLFGKEGQDAISATSVAVVGLGGTGSHVVQQLAYLGVQKFALIDHDLAGATSMNRLVTAIPSSDDGRFKVDIASDCIGRISDGAQVLRVPTGLISPEGFRAVQDADFVFGCVDRDSVRLILMELAQAYRRPLLDIATDVEPENPRNFGGRLVYSESGDGCVYCLNELDHDAIALDFSSGAQRRERDAIYGVPRAVLDAAGPSVVSLNGILASLAVTEFMAVRTGLRPAVKHLVYRGVWGAVIVKQEARRADCFYCKSVFGEGRMADTERYIREGWGTIL